MKKIIVASILLFSICTNITIANIPFNISNSKLNAIASKYGPKAKKRVLLWDKMLQSSKDLGISAKAEAPISIAVQVS